MMETKTKIREVFVAISSLTYRENAVRTAYCAIASTRYFGVILE